MDDADVLSVRLVRCPKCQKRLPEPSNCLIYRCGGCDAVLRVKKNAHSMNAGFPVDGLKESEKHYVTDKLVDHVSDTWGPNDVLDSNTLKRDLIQREDGFRRNTSSNREVEDDDKRAQSEIRVILRNFTVCSCQTFIKEFDYPLQGNYAAGNTDVFVNGRELHQLDLELLASRGLPTVRNRAYKIDICGTVNDERTGEELKSLGLLASSVIRAKRGFGMGVPAKYEYSVNRG